MCIAVPMRVVELHPEDRTATVSLDGNRMVIDVSLVEPVPGDHVLVHAGCALEIVRDDLAAEMLEIFAELREAMNDERG